MDVELPPPLPDWSQLAAYFEGRCTDTDRRAIDRWVSASPAHRDVLHTLRSAWEARQPVGSVPYDRVGVMERVVAHARTSQAPPQRPVTLRRPGPVALHHIKVSTPPRWRPTSMQWGMMAGAIALCAIGSVLWKVHDTGAGTPHVQTYATAPGEQATITFRDGTQVLLNVGSELEVIRHHGAPHTSLRLRGEALFTVQHRDHTAFTVSTAHGDIRVLGTRFSVRQYAPDTYTTVAVQDGRVAAGSAVVSANQQVRMGPHSVSPVTVVHPAHFAFAKRMLVLDPMPLPDAIDALNRWYGVDIRLADVALHHRTILGTFSTGSLDAFAENLEWALNIRVVRRGRTFTLYAK